MSDDALGEVQRRPGRSTRAIVDLDAIAENVAAIIDHLTSDQQVIAVVKAGGYGHGAVMVARTALKAGATMLAVATVSEAAELRAHDIDAPILVLGPIELSEVPRAVSLNCELSVGSRELLARIISVQRELQMDVRVHLKVDTGMHRYGCDPGEAVALAQAIEAGGLELRGISTHFSSADELDFATTMTQRELFESVVTQVLTSVSQAPHVHMANSAATLRGVPGTFIRLGVAMYGLQPGSGAPLFAGMRPAMSVVSKLARVHEAHSGDGVSYGRTFIEQGDELLGLVPIGYGDGLHRTVSNRAWMTVGGVRCPIRGRVCMDQTVIGGLPASAEYGSSVGIMGPLGGGPSFDEVAGWAETINYEVATSIRSRVPRFYLRDGRIVATLIEHTLSDSIGKTKSDGE